MRTLIETFKPGNNKRITAFWVDAPNYAWDLWINNFREEAKALAKRSGKTLPKNFQLRVSEKSY